MQTFDPSHYAPKIFEKDSSLPDDKWIERFVAYMIEEGTKQANDDFKPDVPDYARRIARSYLVDRKQYQDPEEAAWTDLSYWEDEE